MKTGDWYEHSKALTTIAVLNDLPGRPAEICGPLAQHRQSDKHVRAWE
jgi:hypothetical protein